MPEVLKHHLNSEIPRASLSLAKKGALLLAVPVTIQFVLLVLLWAVSRDADRCALSMGVRRDQSVAARNLVMESCFIVLTVERALLLNRGNDPRLGSVREKQLVSADLLRSTFASSAENLQLIDRIVRKTPTLLYDLDRVRLPSSLSWQIEGRTQPLLTLHRDEDALMAMTASLIKPLLGDLSVETSEESNRRRILFLTAIAGTIFNLVVLFVLGIIFNQSFTRRIAALSENTERFAAGRVLLPRLSGDDEIAGLDEKFHEMTARLKETERIERTIFENIDCVLCAVDKLGRIREVNAAAVDVFKRSPSQLRGIYIEDLVPPEERKAAIERISEAVCDGSRKPFELPIVTPAGERIFTLWSARFVPERNMVFCVVQDVTAHLEAERVKREVLHMVTHDLRNPLTTIGLIYFMLASGKIGAVEPEGHHALAVAKANAARLLTIVNNLLDVEKMEAGMLELEFESLDIAEVALKAMSVVAEYAREKKVKLSDECFRVQVRADRFRLQQILVNLLLNAIAASPPDSRVVVSTQPGNGYLKVLVSDSGPGIAVEKRRTIFDRFARKRESGERIGLGLPICRALVRLHNGEIAFDCSGSGGTTFYFSLPYGDGRLAT